MPPPTLAPSNGKAECLMDFSAATGWWVAAGIAIAAELDLPDAAVLRAYVEYYLRSRTHLSLQKDAPVPRQVASPADGDIMAIPHLGGLHHRYERRAA